jgi:hypothetical protein
LSRALGPLVALAAFVALAAAFWVPSAPAQEAPHLATPPETCALPADSAAAYEGESGLWIERARDSLVVHWLTVDSAAGLIVVGAGSTPRRLQTPAGHAHRAALEAGEEPLTILYGLPDRLHEVVIDPHAERERAEYDLPAVDSLYVVGDVHGAYDNLARLLAHAGLIDDKHRWTGGRAHLAFAGDLVDRGPDATRVVWFVRRLEREAALAGGRVHLVLGNHEIMAMAGDHRYVHPKEPRIAACHGVRYQRLFDPRRTVMGRWLATKPGIMKLGDALLAHGGVTPRWAEPGLKAFHDSLGAYLDEELMTAWFDSTATTGIDSAAYDRRYAMFWSQESVFWHRGYALSDTLGAELDLVLEELGAEIHLIGHTPFPSIETRYDGRVVLLNTREFATELLLVAREEDDGLALWRYRLEGPPERLGRPAGP